MTALTTPPLPLVRPVPLTSPPFSPNISLTPTTSASASVRRQSCSSSKSPITRHRGASTTSFADSLASTGSSWNNVSPRRQDDFERIFGERLNSLHTSQNPSSPPDDHLLVLATQSGDLQAKVLLHGRLYLTRYHLCFRSNILGYKTESVHPLKEIVNVEKGTTAKWIQNAVYVTMGGKEEEGYIGYGSLGDRDALFEILVECWKLAAPDKYKAEKKVGVERMVQLDEGMGIAEGQAEERVVEAKVTECSGEGHFEELAIDTTIPTGLEQVYNLIYHNEAFMMEFLEKDKKLTDVKVTGWQTEGRGKRRDLTYVMHMDNSIGPSKSDCIGRETIVISDPKKSYEIVSETQTPDIPSGKKFKILTRTCLTQSGSKTRMYCTTQCDWSSGSWLKGTITPAVIKGQKEHHQQLVKKIRGWIKDHPDEFGVVGGDADSVVDGEEENVGGGDVEVAVVGRQSKGLDEHLREICQSPKMMGLAGLVLVLFLTLVWETKRG